MIQLTTGERNIVRGLFKDVPKWKAAIYASIENGIEEMVVNDKNNPSVAVMFFGGLVVYAGDSSSPDAEELVRVFPEQPLVLGYSDGWNKLLHKTYPTLSVCTRYHLPFENLNKKQCCTLAEQIDKGLVQPCEARDIPMLENVLTWEHQKYHYKDENDFLKRSFTSLAKVDDKIISGASAFIRSEQYAECQVNTIPAMQRKGYASAVAAKFIQTCIEQNVNIPWDAANRESVKLGQKLGYEKVEEYTAFEIFPQE